MENMFDLLLIPGLVLAQSIATAILLMMTDKADALSKGFPKGVPDSLQQ